MDVDPLVLLKLWLLLGMVLGVGGWSWVLVECVGGGGRFSRAAGEMESRRLHYMRLLDARPPMPEEEWEPKSITEGGAEESDAAEHQARTEYYVSILEVCLWLQSEEGER